MFGGDMGSILLLLLVGGSRINASELIETILNAQETLPGTRAALGVVFNQQRAQDRERAEAQLSAELANALVASKVKLTEAAIAGLPLVKRLVDRFDPLVRPNLVLPFQEAPDLDAGQFSIDKAVSRG